MSRQTTFDNIYNPAPYLPSYDISIPRSNL